MSCSFSSVLQCANTSPSHLLKALKFFEGLVFLQDDQLPVIAFLPQQFTVMRDGSYQHYQWTNCGYILDAAQTQFTEPHFLPSNTDVPHAVDGFRGGYISFLSYDFAAQQDIPLKHIKQPAFYWGEYRHFLKFEQGQWIFYSNQPDAEILFQQVQNNIYQHEAAPAASQLQLRTPCSARWSYAQYQQAFNAVQDYIRAGDCYQINLTQEFTAKATGSLLDCAESFWTLTDAPYAGYLSIFDFELLSCSPELFIEFSASRTLKTRPIKGTMPRYADSRLDEQSKQTLMHSEKDRAENLMIVDLLRNDLSVYAEIGSVKTPKLFEIESFNQVHHMVSEITAQLKPEINPFHVLLRALPGGSITGAPKIRAMQIIEELEGAPRGAYCGSLGYFNDDGSGRFNILIRSLQKYTNDLSVWAGGGVTIASRCEAEYQECFDKVSAMLNLINTWQKPQA